MRFNEKMVSYRIAEAALLLGVSDDTIRRWIEAGRLTPSPDTSPTTVEGAELAALAQAQAVNPEADERAHTVSARNRLTGLVTRVQRDGVMAQVDLICGPYRMVSLMSAEAADELGLAPGVRATASVKSTNVVVEIA